MRRLMTVMLAAAVAALVMVSTAGAHFQMVVPQKDVIEKKAQTITVDFIWTHPFEGKAMKMVKPKAAGVLVGKKKIDLLAKLKPSRYRGQLAWTTKYRIAKPGTYIFFVEPTPYWEPAESKYIIHFAKAVVFGLGSEEPWDTMVGFPIEIKPLARPFAAFAGSVFVGQVYYLGKPLPHAEVEVEYFAEGKIKAPNDEAVTFAVKADQNGVFTIGLPKAGWWGFAALVDGPNKIKGKKVEWGGVLWVKTLPW